MKILILFLATSMAAQVITSPVLPLDTTKQYAISPAQQQEMRNWKNVAENARKKHDHEGFSKAHHAWWAACQADIKAHGFPQTAVCDFEKNQIRGKDAQ